MKRRSIFVVAFLALIAGGCAQQDFNLSPACPQFGADLEESEVSGFITLMVQAVPNAALYPCVDRLRPGWDITNVDAERDRTTIGLSSDRLGREFLRVQLLPSCDVADDATVHPTLEDETGAVLYEDIDKTLAGHDEEGEYEGEWWYIFDGGCVEFRFDAEGPGVDRLEDEVREAFSFFERGPLDDLIERDTGIRP